MLWYLFNIISIFHVYVMPPGFEEDPTVVRTLDASGEEARRL